MGLQIKLSLSNWIWNPNLIVDFSPIQNAVTKSSRRSRFRYKIDLFQSKFDLFRLKDWYKNRNGRLKYWKSWLKDQKDQFLSKKLIFIQKGSQIRPFLIKIKLFSIKIDLKHTIFDLNGQNLNQILAAIKSEGRNRIQKRWLKPIWLRFQ